MTKSHVSGEEVHKNDQATAEIAREITVIMSIPRHSGQRHGASKESSGVFETGQIIHVSLELKNYHLTFSLLFMESYVIYAF